MKLLHRRDLVCQQAVELVTDYLDGARPAEELERFEEHLLYCRPRAMHVEHRFKHACKREVR